MTPDHEHHATPMVIVYLKWATVAIVGVTTVCAAAGWLVLTAVRWGSVPIVREESRARQAGDSLIVAQVGGLADQVQLIAEALRYDLGSSERDQLLRRAVVLKPLPVVLPEDVKAGADKP